MEKVRTLIIGAGVSGLAFADWIEGDDYLLCEADSEVGGYCKTVEQDGFIWDYSGHFFHFRDPEIERYLLDRMEGQSILKVERVSRIAFGSGFVDFPFQKNIHQLPKEDFLDCLVDLYFRSAKAPTNFEEMLYAKFGKGIAERFLIPYNRKLYATDLGRLDVDAMGRFFPHADIDEIIRNFREPDNGGYNSHFTYPEGGAIEYVHALAQGVDARSISLNERVESIDLERRVAKTNRREVAYEQLISSAPFPALLTMVGAAVDPEVYSANKVEVFNLGFDRKGPEGVHWIYYPDPSLAFYRVGFYDNIFRSSRMSLYVEIGRSGGEGDCDERAEETLSRVLDDLERVGVVDGHSLISHHRVVLDPAYVHITQRSIEEVAREKARLAASGVHSIGRYGSWTYCSIEDNIIEARALAERLEG